MVTSIPGCDHVSFYTIFLFVRMIMLINIGLINVRLIILLCHDLLFTNIYDENYACCRAYTLPARSNHSDSAHFACWRHAKWLLPRVWTLVKAA